MDIDAYLSVESPKGNLIYDKEHILNDTQIYSEDTDLNSYYLVPSFTLQNIKQLDTPYGDYTVEIKVVDSRAETIDTVTTSFTIQQESSES